MEDHSSRQTDARTSEADARLASIVENSEDAIIGADLAGMITNWNRGAVHVFGYTAEEVIGKSVSMLVPPELIPTIKQMLEVIRHGGSLEHHETTRVRKDGQRIFVSLSVSPMRDRNGKVVGASKIARDITGQKKAEQALRESEDRFRATFEQAAVGIAHVALNGTFLRVNRRLCEIVGYAREELVGKDFASITHPDDIGPDWENVHALLDGRIENYSMEKRYIRKDGSPVWINLTVALVRDDAGAPNYFISIIEDIAARKTAERAMARQADLLDQAQEPILVWELGGGIIYWNRAAEELYGYSREEAIGKRSHNILKTRHSLSAGAFEHQLRASGYWAGELTHTTKDGRVLIVESRHKVVREDDRLLVLESNRDITQRKHAEQQLFDINATLEKRVAERTRQLHEANRELEAFAYSVSHDLRAPLRSIDGFGQILLREYAGRVLDADGELYIRKMSAAAQRMANLIQDLLNLSRISRSELSRQRVNLSDLARSVNADLQSRWPERRVDVKIQDNLIVQADPRLLRVALDNLLGNAWKFTVNQSDATIEFGSVLAANKTVYFVRDNGAGFSMEHAANLFAPFQRLHRDTEFEGTGIGLAIVQRVIHKHGGTISAESEPGRGATFYFTL